MFENYNLNKTQIQDIFEVIYFHAKNGHLNVVIWLHENRTEECSPYAMDSAAKNGHLSVAKWLRANRTEGSLTYAMDKAVKNC